MSTMLAFAAALAAHAPPAGPVSSAPPGGLVSTAQFAVRAVVVDRCRVGLTGVTCEGAVAAKAVVLQRAGQVEITF